MRNPWEEIDLNDYENHMSLEGVYQLQTLNAMMKEQFYTYDVDTTMILGVAGGNGLEHISKEQFKKVYAVDVNQNYLVQCERRYKELEDIFVPICVDLLREDVQLPKAELLIANLLVEYIGYNCFQRVVKIVNPQYISCIIQINTDASFVSDSPYIHVFDCLDAVHHQMDETTLIHCMEEIGYIKEKVEERQLSNGKKLVRIDFANLRLPKR